MLSKYSMNTLWFLSEIHCYIIPLLEQQHPSNIKEIVAWTCKHLISLLNYTAGVLPTKWPTGSVTMVTWNGMSWWNYSQKGSHTVLQCHKDVSKTPVSTGVERVGSNRNGLTVNPDWKCCWEKQVGSNRDGLTVNPRIVTGNVAEKRRIWRSVGRNEMSLSSACW